MTWHVLNYDIRKEQIVLEQLGLVKVEWFVPTVLVEKRKPGKGSRNTMLRPQRLTAGWIFVEVNEQQKAWSVFIPFTTGFEADENGVALPIPAGQMLRWMDTIAQINFKIRRLHEKGLEIPKIKPKTIKLGELDENLGYINSKLFGAESRAA